MTKRSDINISIELDKGKVPSSIIWEATDNPAGQEPQHCKAMLLSLFDKETKDTLKIDLWTKEMQVLEMDRFFYQTLKALADTYFRATQNRELAGQMQQFAHYFGEQTQIVPKSD